MRRPAESRAPLFSYGAAVEQRKEKKPGSCDPGVQLVVARINP
jgi:hypothetical protein